MSTKCSRVFLRYLKNENIYDAWKKNVYKFMDENKVEYNLSNAIVYDSKLVIKKFKMMKFEALTFIQNGFPWNNSFEGYDYWANVYTKFQKALKNYKFYDK